MAGARHADARPRAGAVRTARRLIRVLALSAAGLAVLALIAAVLYLAVAGTSTQGWSITGLLALIMLGTALIRRGHGEAFQAWMAAGMVLAAAAQLLSILADHHGRPAGQVHTMSLAGSGIRATAIACSAVALILGVRSGALPVPWRRTATRDS